MAFGKVLAPKIYKNVIIVSAVCNDNNVQDNGETGVDCGGGGCPVCQGNTFIMLFP